MIESSVLSEYRQHLWRLRPCIDHTYDRQRVRLWLLVAGIALLALLLIKGRQWHVPALCILLPVPATIYAGWSYLTLRQQWARLHRLHKFYERGLARIEHHWHGTGFTGEEFSVPNHVYESDLQILGTGSLFELLCTTRTEIGRRRLAEYLLRPCDAAETLQRQESVRELKPLADLRERIALLGKYDFQESTRAAFSEWTRVHAPTAPAWVRLVACASSAALALTLLAPGISTISFVALLPWMLFLFAINMSVAWSFRERTNSVNDNARRVGGDIEVVRGGIELISSLTFQSAKLKSIQSNVSEGNAASALRQLKRLAGAISECEKPFFDLPSRALIIRTQLCFAIEDWKHRHSAHLNQWLDAWAEFEVLVALSGYAWEHPEDPFPMFHEGSSAFVAHELGHPLIPAETCVRNNVALHAKNRFDLISGSNMSGKSTLLRSIGLNAILAHAGAPVRANSLSLTKLDVFASFSIGDSLLEGRSKFLAEVERLRQTLEGARNSPIVFLIDEILSGTNSRDRRIASELIIQALLERGAIGALSTHDLALTEIADLSDFRGSNVHMASRSGDDPMDFDYLLKPGVTTETNALAIAAMIGLPVTASQR